MFSFSDTSRERLSSCHEDLIVIMNEALSLSDIDFGIAEGHRSVERQKKLYDEGKSKIDGITKKSKHNVSPSLAVDIYAYLTGANWDAENLCYLSGLILSTATRLYNDGKIKSKLRWGGNWGNWTSGANYVGFVDMPHFEIR